MENNKIDSNYIIGIVLLFVMYGAYVFFMPDAPIIEEPVAEKTTEKVTTDAANSAQPVFATPDSAQLSQQYGTFATAVSGEAKSIKIDNEVATFTFNTKGGAIESVTLKEYKTYDNYIAGKDIPLEIIDKDNNKTQLLINTPNGQVDLKSLYFTTDASSTTVSGDSTIVKFSIQLDNSQSVTQTYTIFKDRYFVDYNIGLNNLQSLLTNQQVAFSWKDDLKKLENDLEENRKAAQINWYDSEGDFDDLGANGVSDEVESVEEKISWFAFKQKYFVTGFVSKNSPMENAKFTIDTPEEDSVIVKSVVGNVTLNYSDLSSGNGNFRYYFGPNEYSIVSDVAEGFNQNVYLGYDIIKPVNKYLFVPLFDWFETFISNYGLLIILVVLVIKLTLTPLIYKSYSSSAKMRVMAPEIAAIKEKVGDDQVKVQQETMNLYKQVGVSPLSGCVPMLLQMPILMSVFFLFPNMIMFRQESFLWAKDLSTYDAPIQWATSIPIVGDHLSLFVVLMTISSLAFTYYNNQITPDQAGPIDMKKISYIFPLVFFFVLNSFAAALSFYYLMSNLVTIGQQLIVRRFIDEDKIRSVLDENRKNYATKPKKKNKFTEYMQKQLNAQEEANRKKATDLGNKRKNKK